MIRIGCCSFCFGGLDLDASLGLCRTLGFRHVDVSAADVGPKAQVDQQVAVSDPEGQARRASEISVIKIEFVTACAIRTTMPICA